MNEWFDAESHVDRALDFFERGRWAEAESELRKAISINPDQAEWHFNLGLTLEAAGRHREAMTSFLRASELMPDAVHPLLSTAGTALRLGQTEEAVRWYATAAKLDPSCEQAFAGQIESLLRLGRHDEAETVYYLSQQSLEENSTCLAAIAVSLIEREQWEKAEWCLREALRLSPTMPRVRGLLGKVYAAREQSHRAIRMFLRELRDDPGNTEALLDYGDLLVDLRRYPEAAEKYRRVLELEPANVDAHVHLGELCITIGRHEQAQMEFELVMRLAPDMPGTRLLLAETLLKQNKLDEARDMLTEELRLIDDPDRSASNAIDAFGWDFEYLGSVLLDAEMPLDAAAIFEREIRESGETVETLRKLAFAYFRAGERDRGTAVSRRVLRLEPGNVESMHNLALAALEGGRLKLAMGWVNRGMAVNPRDEDLRRLRVRVWSAAAGVFLQRVFGLRRSAVETR